MDFRKKKVMTDFLVLEQPLRCGPSGKNAPFFLIFGDFLEMKLEFFFVKFLKIIFQKIIKLKTYAVKWILEILQNV